MTGTSGSAKLLALASVALASVVVSCDRITPPPDPPRESGPIVSDPVESLAGSFASIRAGAALAYVSLPPGTVPGGELAQLNVESTGASTMTAMSDGGFDPTPVPAFPGDTVWVEVELSTSAVPHVTGLEVPDATPPRVVRTRPAQGKRDVVLNEIIVVVFSEPVDVGTVSTATIRLQRGGTLLPTEVRLLPDGLTIEVRPQEQLASNAGHRLTITTGIRDQEGDALEQEYSAEFATGSSVAQAAVSAYPAALLELGGGQVRTFEFAASRDASGQVDGYFRGYNPGGGGGGGHSWAGRVTCFAIVDGREAWVAGVVEEHSDTSGWLLDSEVAWKAADYGDTGQRPDELSFMMELTINGLGTGAEYCTTTPDLGVGLVLVPLLSGDIAVTSPVGGAPVALAFSRHPANAPPGRPIEPVRVAAVDASGETATGFAGTVRLALVGSGGAMLAGSTVAQAIGGVAEFTDLAVDLAGTGYSLAASADGLNGAVSDRFEIVEIEPGRIAFYRRFADDSDRNGLYVMNSDGSGIHRLSPHPDFWPSWSPDGSRIAVERVAEPAIYVMNADGSGARRIRAGSRPAWSPDGSSIAFVSDFASPGFWQLYTMASDGSGLRQVTSNGGIGRPAWSPDGQRLAFVSREDTVFDLWSIRTDGSDMIRLSRLRACLQAAEPAWSPDGTTIAFTVDHSAEDWEPCAIELLGLHLVNPDGTGLRRFGTGWTLDRGVAWSPDGTRLAFSRHYDHFGGCGRTIAIQRLDGTGLVRLDLEGCDWTPAWIP